MTKWRMKERVLWKLKRKQWDGYYYIGLNDEQHEEFKKKKKYFYNVYLTKIEKELYHNKLIKHIWRVPWIEDCGWHGPSVYCRRIYRGIFDTPF